MEKNNRNPNLIPVSPPTEIADVIEAEAANLRSSQTALGERRKLAADVLGLYDLINRNVAPSKAASEDDVGALLVMRMLLSGCRFQFTMSVLQNWRGRTAEGLAPLRKAAELCGSACHIRNRPALASVWQAASDSDDAYKRHKDAFKLRSIFPKSDPILNRLFDVFDFASKVAHASIFSISGQTDGFSFRYFDIEGPHDPALIRTFIYIVGSHELMLKAFVGAFHDTFRDDAVVARELNIFSERLQRHRDAHRAFAMSDISEQTLKKLAKKRV